MITELPDDILHVLCTELSHRQDFDTLFNCAVTSKRFAIPALTSLYRIHHKSPVTNGGNEAVPLPEQELVVYKWSILWRSIIASSLEKTLFPYCRYTRVLDLRDLTYLLEDPKFRGRVLSNFFAGDLARFYITSEASLKATRAGVRSQRLNVVAIIDAIAEEVTQHTPMLDQISGHLLASALVRWAPRLPKLRSLELWEGEALSDERMHELIHTHCPNFESLSIYIWRADYADHKLSVFLNSIRPQTLRYFETISDVRIGPETCLASNNHCQSLKTIKMSLKSEALPHLAFMKGCTAVEVLQLTDTDRTVELEKTEHDVFLEVIAWLRECRNLRELGFTNFLSAAAIVTPLLLEERIQLQRLQVDYYVVKDNRDFHVALAHQPSLRSLFLKGDGYDGITRDDLDIMMESLGRLTELRELEFRGVSDLFDEARITYLAEHLKNLEDLYVGGTEVTDAVWEELASLRNLRSLTFVALSKFTTDGLLEFISKLGPGNRGMVLTIDNAHQDDYLSEEEQNLVREALFAKVGGRFEYTLWRDPEISSFEGESD